MQTYHYEGKYLPIHLIEECFYQRLSYINKSLTGNGFSSGFLKIPPTKPFHSNMLIVPNKEVIKSKQEAYNNILAYGGSETLKNLKSTIFLYGDISSDKLEFSKHDNIVIIAETFLNYIDRFKENSHLIDKVLIDEYHSFLIQSNFRDSLVGFVGKVVNTLEHSQVVCLTATPMLFQDIDVTLRPKKLEYRDIHITTNQEKAFKRLKDLLANGERCVVAIQDVRLIKHLTDRNGRLEANVKVGKSLMRKIVQNVELVRNKESNLTIVSSSGFEGFDVENGINNVFIFEDRKFDHQTFYPQNIIQIIGRSRQGVDYIEWCRMPNAERVNITDKEKLEKQMQSTKISAEKKMTDKNYSDIPKYYDIIQDEKTGLIIGFTFKEIKYNLDKELIDADRNGIEAMYKEYFLERGFTLVNLNEGHRRLKLRSVGHKKAFENLKLNEDTIKLYSLMEGLKVDVYSKESLAQYKKAFEVFLRQKYWHFDTLPFDVEFHLTDEIIASYSDLENELFLYSILSDEELINQDVEIIKKEAIKSKLGELDKRSKEFLQWREDLLENVKDRYIRLLLTFSQRYIRLPKKIRNSRDYNLFTENNLVLIDTVADMFKHSFIEFDIVSCNIRIIYAYLGLTLPGNFYGEAKKHKKGINSLLNRLSSDVPKANNWDEKNYRKMRIKEMRKYGFDERVISFLINKFWDKSVDAVFNFCAYHEKQIIEKVTKEIRMGNDNGIIRRHDSILYFGTPNDEQVKAVYDFEYLGVKGWFIDDKFDLIEA